MGEHTYIRVRWLHGFPDEPVDLWSELDRARFETRKLEFFRDGTVGFASAAESAHGTELGSIPVPSLEEIATDPQFLTKEISQAAFERRWKTRHSR
jgi:Domain of unknown function (DUF6881)